MQIYLVGGAIRDRLLNLPVHERDWVVVGATPEEMIAQGFQPIGKEFPVFLHPETHEEYALARTERKIERGYKGFTFYTDPSVTLEQDLLRRDLTINAIAEDAKGHYIDPFHGQDDIQNKIFRHVSAAFEEDPVRILRVARLASKLTEFTLHPDTLQFMRNMVIAGEVDALVAERVWQEWRRALENPAPARFFALLQDCGALEILFPSLHTHSQGLQCLQQSTAVLTPWVRLAILFSDATNSELKKIIARYKIPNQYAELSLLVNSQLTSWQNLNLQEANQILAILTNCDALRRPERFFDFLTVAAAVSPAESQSKVPLLKKCLTIINAVDTKALQAEGVTGKEFAEKLKELRLVALQRILF